MMGNIKYLYIYENVPLFIDVAVERKDRKNKKKMTSLMPKHGPRIFSVCLFNKPYFSESNIKEWDIFLKMHNWVKIKKTAKLR